jgi:hypothetical protein
MLKKRRKVKDKKVLFTSNKKNLKKLRKKRKVQALKEKINYKQILSYLLIFALFIGTIYLIANIFNKEDAEEIETKDTVLGLDDIPTYPESIFLYQEDINNQTVKDMLSEGKSAYKINSNTDFDEVKKYYVNELNSKGWNLVLDVEIGAADKKYGQYWIKGDKGLRIYSKYNDIWYEYITPEEAENGLSNRVSEEIEIDMLLAGSDYQDLLPDYPWQIKIPKDYLISYEVSEFEELRAVNFQRISSGQSINIYPIGYWGAKALDFQLEDYIVILSQGTENWNVINTVVTSWRSNSSLKGAISSATKEKEILMLNNERNNVTYILNSENSSDPLYEYIIENIKYLGQEDDS